MDKDINRIKIVLAEKKERTNGWLSNWGVLQQQCQNGAPMFVNQRWRHISRYLKSLK